MIRVANPMIVTHRLVEVNKIHEFFTPARWPRGSPSRAAARPKRLAVVVWVWSSDAEVRADDEQAKPNAAADASRSRSSRRSPGVVPDARPCQARPQTTVGAFNLISAVFGRNGDETTRVRWPIIAEAPDFRPKSNAPTVGHRRAGLALTFPCAGEWADGRVL
jgi:hypothetical protein